MAVAAGGASITGMHALSRGTGRCSAQFASAAIFLFREGKLYTRCPERTDPSQFLSEGATMSIPEPGDHNVEPPKKEPSAAHPHYALIAAGVIVVGVCLALAIATGGPAAHPPATPAAASVEPAPAPAPPPRGYWQFDSETNPVTGVLKETAYLKYHGDENIVIRLDGKQLDCYVTTGEFLETLANMHSRISTVQYKFDDGKVVRQGWSIGADNTVLFYPGSCAPFLAQLRKSTSLAFEYRPADKMPKPVVFDITAFPEEFRVAVPPSVRGQPNTAKN